MTLVLGQFLSRSQLDQYTGVAGELSIDSSNMDLRLHDGVVRGGHAVLSRNNADQRYQQANVELSGFAGVDVEVVGIIVRVGVGEFRYRSLEVEAGQLTLVNGDAYEGNPRLGLPDTITKDLTFSGDVEFSAGVTAPTFEGNLTGNVTGNVTGNLTGNVTGDLEGDTQGTHVGPQIGSVDVRGAALLLDNNQISTQVISGLDERIVEYGIPSGVIVMWSGLEASVPEGWFMCNGLNGTPDLRDRFIVGAGAGGAYAPGVFGGATSRSLTAETTSGGVHSHAVTGSAATGPTGITLSTTTDTVDDGGSAPDILKTVTINDPSHSHAVTGVTNDSVSHTHEVDLDFDVRPPYFALCFIMKG